MATPDQIRIFEHAKSLLNATFDHVILSVTFHEPGSDQESDMMSCPIDHEKAVAMAEGILRDVKLFPEVTEAKASPSRIRNDLRRIRDIIVRAEAAAAEISEAQDLLGDSYRSLRLFLCNMRGD